jgi:nucleoside 2-deoxyribosyltransferase
MYIYFAGPLFNQGERDFNQRLATTLEEHGHTVFLPQRDGINPSILANSGMTEDEIIEAIFTLDRGKLLETDALLFVLDGRVPDEGACVELGLAYGQKYLLGKSKLLIGLHTDFRAAFPWSKRNALIDGALDHIAIDEQELLAILESGQQSNDS